MDPPKKRIQTDVSITTPATDLLQIDLQFQLSAESHGPIVESPSLDLRQSFDDRLGNSSACGFHGGLEKIRGEVGSDSTCGGHGTILITV
jgi:hypothetical protein